MRIGAIEGGGTKFVAAILSFDAPSPDAEPPRILDSTRIATADPESTIRALIDFFQKARSDREPLAGLGLGMFGPVECDRRSPGWGCLLNTPKRGWADIDIARRLELELGVPVGLETDVAAAALGEWQWGAGLGTRVCSYVTVGTGIGAGTCVDGRVLRGNFHPELGHTRVRKPERDKHFAGVCLHHGDCLEGLASGPAIHARWGIAAEHLPLDHPAWALEADYLAQAFVNLALAIAPDRIVVGGGIGLREGLLDLVADRIGALLGGYIRALDNVDAIRRYVVRAELGAEAGILGAGLLGLLAAR